MAKYSGALNSSLGSIAEVQQWVAWQLVPQEGREAKIPIDPYTGRYAKADDKSTWSDFDTAYQASEKLKQTSKLRCGVGFEMGGGYAGIDLDGCIDDAGNLSDMAEKVIQAMQTYTEISPRGHGLHMLCRVPEGFTLEGKDGVKRAEIEIYVARHYLTVTSNVFRDLKPIEYRPEELLSVYHEYFSGEPPKEAKKQPVDFSWPKNSSGGTEDISDAELLQKMFSSQNGHDIQRLFTGDISAYGGDESRADLALCNYLAYWTNLDLGRMDSLFRQSGLMRPKWEEKRGSKTYGEMTLEEAVKGKTAYQPHSPVATQGTRAVIWNYEPVEEPETPKKQGGIKWEYNPEHYDSGEHEIPEMPEAKTAEKFPYSVLNYLALRFESDIAHVQKYQALKTGFTNIDKTTSLYPGLYVIGAVSSLGKTTFCGQMADYLAKQGKHVLFFSLEQTELDLVSKGLSRLTALEVLDKYGFDALEKYQHTDAVSSLDIRNGRITPAIRRALDLYKSFGEHLHYVECNFEVTAQHIINTVVEYMQETGEKPVVFIDYLQLVRNPDKRLSTKDAVDDNVRAFKKLSAENDLVVIAISSLNRQNYLSVVDYESFKETGAIEYTCDVVWGLQLLAMNANIFNTNQDLQVKRKFVERAKGKKPRQMEIRTLKNRNTQGVGRFFFDYYSAYELFLPYEVDADVLDMTITVDAENFKAGFTGESEKKSKRGKPKDLDAL